MTQKEKEKYIRRCFELALRGVGHASPNPFVGAVVVKNGKVIGEGWHKEFGSHHAEVNAIGSASESVEDSTVFVNLEPCCHLKKKTPPCTDLLIKSGIKKVIFSNLDPNPEVSGKGVDILRAHGIEVEHGILREEGEELNQVFFKYIKTKTPFVHLKWAQTIDGKICDEAGDSKWITDELARKEVHFLRHKYDGISVGRETLNKDNPSLNVRFGIENPSNPTIVVFGNPRKINLNSSLFNPANDVIVISHLSERIEDSRFKFIGIDHPKYSREYFQEAFKTIGEMGISSLLVEGGSKLISSLVKFSLYDKLSIYVAPKLLGSGTSSFIDDRPMSDSIRLKNAQIRTIGQQAVIEAEAK